ncbi:MAG: hypothetical protein KDA85_02680 [Planctomycetaceae bacterium]|nr:hypothetical protein [Planctomycetaceae bacterium]
MTTDRAFAPALLALLRPVIRRHKQQECLNQACRGLRAGLLTTILLLLGQQLLGQRLLQVQWSAVLLLPALLPAVLLATIRLIRRDSPLPAARICDRYFQLKDRLVSSVQFATSGTPLTPLTRLLLQETCESVQSLSLPEAMRWQWPTQVRSTFAVTILLGFLLLLLPAPVTAPINSSMREARESTAAAIAADLTELADLAEETGNTDLQQLVNRLREDAQQLTTPETSIRDAMATVSTMQARLNQMRAALDIELIDAQFANLGAALAEAAPLRPAGSALMKQQLSEAADALDELQQLKLEHPEALAVADQLDQVASTMQQENLKELGDKVEQLADNVRNHNGEGMQAAGQSLAESIREHQSARQLAQALRARAQRMADSKSAMRDSQQKAQTAGGSNEQQDKLANGSGSGGKNAGSAAAGATTGEAERLQSQLQMVRLAGQLGEQGDSETERTTDLAPREESAQRQAQQVHSKYQRMSEAAIESEQIPPGHRETIRRYFSSIRPGN